MPRTLKPILALREQLKARAKEVPPDEAVQYKERQTALKWMLVTCFGYLGYKNARFGRIEAHEAVTAHGRDKLLTAKEISEAAGYTVLHGLTDCLWLHKAGSQLLFPSPPWGGEGRVRGGSAGIATPHPNPLPSKGRGGFVLPPLCPCPPFSKGGSKSPFGKGGFRGICSFRGKARDYPQ